VQANDEVRLLLHKRLATAALLATGMLALAIVVLIVQGGWFLQDYVGHGLACGAVATLAIVFRARSAFSLRRLRLLEMVFYSVIWGFFSWFSYRTLLSWLLPLCEMSPHHAPKAVASYLSLRWFALLLAYGAFIPNTWRRCAVFTGISALTPEAVVVAAWVASGVSAEMGLAGLLAEVAFWMVAGSAIAIYGCHRIELLRRQAFEARWLRQYLLKERLGAGGMGEVYLAEHRLLRRPCAIKLILPERAGDPGTLLRFEREVQATATLTHPNTVEIYDYGRAEDGTFYYVMEYLPGLALNDLIAKHGPLPPGRAVHILRQVAAALGEAHRHGLIHRDIKPSNILLCQRGGDPDVAKLVDFGLVKTACFGGEEDQLTQEGSLAGTPAWMSPEQAASKVPLDGRSDLYSLGAVAYYLLTGQPPFVRATAVQVLAAHIGDPPRPLNEFRADVPPDLQAVVLRCLEKEPGQRFPDAESLEAALAGCLCAGQWTRTQALAWWQTHAGRKMGEA
jgi:serine/threonine-protein kinase